MEKGYEALDAIMPVAPDWSIDWDAAAESPFLAEYVDKMAKTLQNFVYHGEGDVWVHTRMVCEDLAAMEAFRSLSERERRILFLAALLHDIGKIYATSYSNGAYHDGGHDWRGAGMVRPLLWRMGLCGTAEKQDFRETVCALVFWHTVPAFVIEDEDGARLLRSVASVGKLAPSFSLRLLCLLAEANALGRRSAERENLHEMVLMGAELAKDLGCYVEPTSSVKLDIRHIDFPGQIRLKMTPQYLDYDPTWGTVIMLYGLPGTGRGAWIQAHYPDLPVVCLGEICREKGIPRRKATSDDIDEVQHRAFKLLEQRRPFVWIDDRLYLPDFYRWMNDCCRHKAAVKLVFLETEEKARVRRNLSRKEPVSEYSVNITIDVMEVPYLTEAREVEWHCV